ncbi:TMEM175 family protein [Streptomyces sp. NPDC056938]|uniref:TMEM175 family protein n=1 Tax=unclassified Streptomyces TaxID=2593676 RepID=UPI00362D9B95
MNESEGRPLGQPGVDLVSKDRMLALTDGVVAIAMTLLVLDIKLPEGLHGAELHQALEEASVDDRATPANIGVWLPPW